MIFVEVFRLLLVIAGTIGGLTVGNEIGRNTTAPVVGITLGALASYLLGGIIGRLIDRGLRGAVSQLRTMPASSVFAGSVVGTTGLLLGLVAGLPVVALVHSSIDYPLVSAFAWVLCAAGVRIGVAKGQEIVRAAGMSHLLDRPAEPPPGTALLVDSSAVMDRYLMVLGRVRPPRRGRRAAAFRGRRGPGPVPQPRPGVVAPRPPRPRGDRGAAGRRRPGVDERGRGPRARRQRRPRPGAGPPPPRPPGHVLGRAGVAGRRPKTSTSSTSVTSPPSSRPTTLPGSAWSSIS